MEIGEIILLTTLLAVAKNRNHALSREMNRTRPLIIANNCFCLKVNMFHLADSVGGVVMLDFVGGGRVGISTDLSTV